MGHDISPIGNHNLNTANLQVLAEDLSARLDINIEYGYVGIEPFFKLLDQDLTKRIIIIGTIIRDENFKTFRLLDDNYQDKELYEKFGDKWFDNPDWGYQGGKTPKSDWIAAKKREILSPNFGLNILSDIDTDSLCIHKECYSNYIPYFSRWWTFCRTFVEDNFQYGDSLPALLGFRTELMRYTALLGGDKMYYLDDQSKELRGVGQGGEGDLNWSELEAYILDKTAPLMLNVSLFMTDTNYRDAFIAQKEYPLSFYDDFADIKNT